MRSCVEWGNMLDWVFGALRTWIMVIRYKIVACMINNDESEVAIYG